MPDFAYTEMFPHDPGRHVDTPYRKLDVGGVGVEVGELADHGCRLDEGSLVVEVGQSYRGGAHE